MPTHTQTSIEENIPTIQEHINLLFVCFVVKYFLQKILTIFLYIKCG